MALPGKLDVSATGAATYDVPIAVPPGTAGMAPSLSLSYNSQGGNGLLGIGWSLAGLPSIGRCPQTFVQDGVRGGITFTSSDRFCLDSQRLVAINGGTYGADGTEYRTEVDSFTRVISHGTAGNGPAWFEVHTKSGQIMEFGNTPDSLVLAQGKTTARNWAVNRVSDTTGNYFTVTYTNDTTNGQAYPIEIDYTGNAAAGLAPYNKVQFVYATRPDIMPVYLQGSMSKTTVRLTDVMTYAGATLVSDYKLAYQQSAATQISELDSITECAGDGTCLPATSFAWTNADTPQFAAPVGWNGGNLTGTGWGLATGDINGDGKADLVAYVGATNGLSTKVALSNGDGTFSGPISWLGTVISSPACCSGWSIATGDFNGDGKTDLIAYHQNTRGTAWIVDLFLSNGDGTFSVHSLFNALNGSAPILLGDFNGDGCTDVMEIGLGTTGWQTLVALSNCDGTLTSTTTWQQAGNWTGWGVTTGDFNGDGKTDLMLYVADGTSWRTYVALSNGDGTFTSPIYWQSVNNYTGWLLTTGDFNGDGRTDLMLNYPGNFGSGTYVALSNGDGTFTSPIYWQPAGNWSGWNVLPAGDFNGDGRSDLFVLGTNGSAWFLDVALSNGDGTFTSPTGAAPLTLNPRAANFGDFNGDGRTDLLAIGPWQKSLGYSLDTQIALSPSQSWGLASITSGLGATTSINYLPLTTGSIYTKDTNAVYPLQDVQGPMYVVSGVTAPNGIGGTYSTTHTYAGAKLDLSGRGFLGFRQHTVTDPQTGIVQTTNFLQNFPYLGLTASETKTLGSQTLNQTTNSYQFSNASGAATVSTPSNTSAPYQVTLAQSVAASFDLDGSTIPPVTTTYQYDAFGNPTQIVAATPDGFSKTTANSYVNDTTNWFLGRLTGASVTSTTP